MGIGAARAKGGYTSDARVLPYLALVSTGPQKGALPFHQGLGHGKGAVGEIDVGVQGGRVQRGHETAVLELQQDLGDPGNTCSALAVPDVRLNRADGAELVVAGVFAENLRQGGDLDRVAQGGASAVGLQVTQHPGVNAGPLEGLADGIGLGMRVGDGVPVGLAAVVDGAALDDPINLVAVRDGLQPAV